MPEPKRTGTRRGGVNARAICISEPHVLEEMKLEKRKKADEQMKLEKKAEWERKKLERGEMRKEKEQRRKKKQLEKQEQQRGKAKKGRNKKQEERDLESKINALKLDEASDRTDDNAICPKCGVLFVDRDDFCGLHVMVAVNSGLISNVLNLKVKNVSLSCSFVKIVHNNVN